MVNKKKMDRIRRKIPVGKDGERIYQVSDEEIDEICEIKYVPQNEELLEVRTKSGRVLLRNEKGVL